ncbi:MAG: hypothetical protein U1F11_06915 [Steroidobacteraceae bacterium]
MLLQQRDRGRKVRFERLRRAAPGRLEARRTARERGRRRPVRHEATLERVRLELDAAAGVDRTDLRPGHGPIFALARIGRFRMQPGCDEMHRACPMLAQQRESDVVEIARAVVEGQHHRAFDLDAAREMVEHALGAERRVAIGAQEAQVRRESLGFDQVVAEHGHAIEPLARTPREHEGRQRPVECAFELRRVLAPGIAHGLRQQRHVQPPVTAPAAATGAAGCGIAAAGEPANAADS